MQQQHHPLHVTRDDELVRGWDEYLGGHTGAGGSSASVVHTHGGREKTDNMQPRETEDGGGGSAP